MKNYETPSLEITLSNNCVILQSDAELDMTEDTTQNTEE